MLLQSFGAPVTRLRATSRPDSYGDVVEDWAEPDRLRLFHVDVQDVSSIEEDGVTRRLVTDQRRLAIRGVADVNVRDRIELEGAPWAVDGDPVVVRPRIGVPFTIVQLRRITG